MSVDCLPLHLYMKTVPMISISSRKQLRCTAIIYCNILHQNPSAQYALELFPQIEAKCQGTNFDVAVKELKEKMASWNIAYHGTREYMLCCAAAGNRLRFFAVCNGGKQFKAISREFNTLWHLDRLQVQDDALYMPAA